jgi:hypothetical protein
MKNLILLWLISLFFHWAMEQKSPHGKIKIACEVCHTVDSWKMRSDSKFDHASTGFDLMGVHKKIECTSCHKKFNFSGTKKTCGSCHTDVHKGELGNNCLRCHSTDVWKITDMIQRHQLTRFSLFGKHGTASCQSCHEKSAYQQYTGTPTTCVGCHRLNYLNTKNPNHVQAGFSTECDMCHRIDAFTWSSGFDHQLTAFPLTGAHRAVPCSKCHINAVFRATPKDCYSCHQTDFKRPVNPNHAAGNFVHTCEQCHTTTVWSPSTFNHANTAFPLLGAHKAVPCMQCHSSNVYAGLFQNCIDCHRTDFNTASNPNHVSGNFSAVCTMCHSMTAWRPAAFDHAATKFPLTGAHTTVQCQNCHTNGNYQLVYAGCYTCHQNDFNRVTDPNHVTGNFSHQCETCHSTSSWSSATFDHSATKFALSGAHTTVQCQTCHTNGNYQLVYSGCYTCHQNNFNQVTNPNHVTGNFSHQCETCHSTSSWSSATFDHSATKFALSGAHTTVQCQNCHTNGNYQLAYINCYQCHQSDYQSATNPNHAAGYPQSCDSYQCHSTVSWTSSTFNHDTQFFRIYSGAHQGKWSACINCHQAPADLSNFTCTTNCHPKAQTDNDHSGVNTYVYASPNCYSCHRKN